MDAESNYEADLSESWSLIDINLNEESLITDETSPELEKTHSTVIKCKKTDEIELQDFVRKCKDLNEMGFSQISDFDSDSDFDFTFKKQTYKEIYNKKEGVQSFLNLDSDERNDSGDAESIEILDIEGNYQDSENERFDAPVNGHFDFETYQSNDEDSSSGRFYSEGRSDSLTVIKRKKRRVSRDLIDTRHCLVSGNTSISDTKGVSDKFIKANNHVVYKHYRNNVANTILSLSVGVIFAGVACIAVGHFLGVQDAAETAMELVDTLKKLQVENAALQSSMIHLKKALLTLETNSKLELPLNPAHDKAACEEAPKINFSNAEFVRSQGQADLNTDALSEICSYLNFIERLPKSQNILKKGGEAEGAEIDIQSLRKLIHDKINLLKDRGKGNKVLEDTDLLKTQRENKKPASELDLKTIHWTPNSEIDRDSRMKSESRVLHKFPQLEKYYNFETSLEPKTPNVSLKNDHWENLRKNKKKHKISESEKNANKKLGKKKWKKENEKKDKKRGKKRKCKVEKSEKKESENVKYGNNSRSFNRTDFPYNKMQEKDVKYKRRVKKIKKSKLKKVKKKCASKKKYVPFYSEAQCFNLTGYWIFKWADGRKEFRRHQTISDWQFDRAKARKDVRDIELSNNWQFERAKARKELRSEDFGGDWQFKRALARQKSRNDDQTHEEKFTKYSGKTFFQERFSWI